MALKCWGKRFNLSSSGNRGREGGVGVIVKEELCEEVQVKG